MSVAAVTSNRYDAKNERDREGGRVRETHTHTDRERKREAEIGTGTEKDRETICQWGNLMTKPHPRHLVLLTDFFVSIGNYFYSQSSHFVDPI